MVKSQSEFTETSRTRAREIKARMHEAGTPVTLQQAYELLAKESGYRTWAAMKASAAASDIGVAASNQERSTEGDLAATPRFRELLALAQKELAEVVEREGFNPLSVASGAAYNLSQSLDEDTLRRIHGVEPWLTRVDFNDGENQANFGKPRTELDRMRFAVAVAVLDRIDLSPYAKLLASYGWQPYAIERLQGRVAITYEEEGKIVMDGVSYPVTTIRSF